MIAELFAEYDADIIVADMENASEADAPIHEVTVEDTNASATFVECAVSDVNQFGEAAEEFGGDNATVNGWATSLNKRLRERSEFNDMMDINLEGVFFGA